MPKAAIEAMISSSLGHRLLQVGYDMQSKDAVVIARRLQTHRGNAMRLLSELVADPISQQLDPTLAAVVIFLLSDVSHLSFYKTNHINDSTRSSNPFLPHGAIIMKALMRSCECEVAYATISKTDLQGLIFPDIFSCMVPSANTE